MKGPPLTPSLLISAQLVLRSEGSTSLAQPIELWPQLKWPWAVSDRAEGWWLGSLVPHSIRAATPRTPRVSRPRNRAEGWWFEYRVPHSMRAATPRIPRQPRTQDRAEGWWWEFFVPHPIRAAAQRIPRGSRRRDRARTRPRLPARTRLECRGRAAGAPGSCRAPSQLTADRTQRQPGRAAGKAEGCGRI